MYWILITRVAQLIDLNPLPKVADPSNPKSGPATVGAILQIVFAIIGAIAVFMFTYGGFKFVMSRGNPDEASKARDTIIYAAIGVVISLLAYAIVSFVVGRLS